jgi:hypothetical protein
VSRRGAGDLHRVLFRNVEGSVDDGMTENEAAHARFDGLASKFDQAGVTGHPAAVRFLLGITRGALRAIAGLVKHGVGHHDIKLDNFMVI